MKTNRSTSRARRLDVLCAVLFGVLALSFFRHGVSDFAMVAAFACGWAARRILG